jgi:hypothetical protein
MNPTKPTPTLALPLRCAASHFVHELHCVSIVDDKEYVLVPTIEQAIGHAIVEAVNAHAALTAENARLRAALEIAEKRMRWGQQVMAGQAADLEARGDELAEGLRHSADEYLRDVEQARSALAGRAGA